MALNRDAIAALIYDGAMCLLEEVVSFDDDCIVCRMMRITATLFRCATTASYPRYAVSSIRAQAMALHGALMDTAADKRSTEAQGRRGMLAAARDVAWKSSA